MNNKQHLGKTFLIVPITGNRKRIFLNTIIKDVIGFRVQGIVWDSAPEFLYGQKILTVSSDDLVENTTNQSMMLITNPKDNSGSLMTIQPRSIIASFFLDRTGNPHPNGSQYKQEDIWYSKPYDIHTLSFILATENDEFDLYGTTFHIVLVLYYNLQEQ